MKNLKKGGIVAMVLLIAYGVYDFWVFTVEKRNLHFKYLWMDDFELGDFVESKCDGKKVTGNLYRRCGNFDYIGDVTNPEKVYACDSHETKEWSLW